MEASKSNDKFCEVCGALAEGICFKCSQYLCDSCFKLVHNRKENSQHKKEKIDYFVPIETKCPSHPNHPMVLFCLDEKGKIFEIYNIL